MFLFNFSVLAHSETKNVCIDKYTNDGKAILDKNGKQVKECRQMKIHKKLEGKKLDSSK
jgi:hypothetical protein